MPEITINQQTIPYIIRHSKRAQNIRLKIDTVDGLQVIIPTAYTLSTAEIEEVIQQHKRWLMRHYQPVAKRQYTPDETLLYLGKPRAIQLNPNKKRRSLTIQLIEDTFHITLPTDISDIDRLNTSQRAFEKWYRQRAKAYILPRVAELATKHGFTFNKIFIKNQKTRWGSCSSNKNLNFNLRLMMAPTGGIDYVIIHELCHLEIPNHSQKFWQLVGKLCPEYKQWEKWFKENGTQLQI